MCAGADVTLQLLFRLLTQEAQWCGDRHESSETCSEQRRGWASYQGGVHAGIWTWASTLTWVTLLGALALPEFEVAAQSSQRMVQGETVPVEPQETST